MPTEISGKDLTSISQEVFTLLPFFESASRTGRRPEDNGEMLCHRYLFRLEETVCDSPPQGDPIGFGVAASFNANAFRLAEGKDNTCTIDTDAGSQANSKAFSALSATRTRIALLPISFIAHRGYG